MADDFRINIESQVDLSKAKSDIDKFLSSYKNDKLKISVAFDTKNNELSKIQKEINQLKSHPIDIKVKTSGLNNLKKTQNDFKILKNLANEIGQKKVKIASLDSNKSSNQIKELSSQLRKLQSDYDVLYSSFSKNLSTSQIGQLNNILGKSSDRVAELNAKTKDLAENMSKATKPFNQLDAVVAGNKTLTWLNNNTKAAKEYGEVLEDLARKQKSATSHEELAEYNKQVKSLISDAQVKGLAGKSAIDEIGRALKQIGEFTSIYGLLQNVIYEVPQQMVQAVKDINKSQIELTKVSTASTSELSSYWDRVANSAKKYGSTISDVINSTADWSRLGYSLKDAEKLSDATTLLNNVGDNMTQESSSSGLISTLRGFQLQAEQAESIVDKVNEIANTQPIDTSGIFAGLERSASSMSAANNTLEETIALITAANSVVQDPASVGTAFKTISMRIRGAETELEQAGLETDGMAESTAKLRQEIMALSGIDIMIDNDTFKSTYDILDELSNKWKDLTDIQQASITELIAGKRQGNIVSALMTNFDIARESLDTALNNSEGSATRELENWNKGIEASVEHFKAQFQELASVTISSDFFKGFVDSGTNVINIITQIIDKVGILTPLIAGFATKNGLGKRNATLYKVKQNNRRFINVESFIA